jgi:hypothetical protein
MRQKSSLIRFITLERNTCGADHGPCMAGIVAMRPSRKARAGSIVPKAQSGGYTRKVRKTLDTPLRAKTALGRTGRQVCGLSEKHPRQVVSPAPLDIEDRTSITA